MKANNDIAKDFQVWMATDVIPSIRKTGQYIESSNSLVKTNNMTELKEFINEMKNEKNELGQYYRPTHKKKLDINRHIKNCLGVNATRENADMVKEILLARLGNYHTYEEVPKDILHTSKTADLIFEICNSVNSQFGQVQECMF